MKCCSPGGFLPPAAILGESFVFQTKQLNLDKDEV